jgi:hypothetical protein
LVIGGERPPITNLGTARELIEFAGESLDADQRAALGAWTRGDGFDEIAKALNLSGGKKDAERLVRAALERIRRRFRSEDGGAS